MKHEQELTAYVSDLFAVEDQALKAIRERQQRQGLPPINISADEGKLLQVLLRAVGARRVLEIGALAGYSGVWLARALPDDGMLTTIELDPRHAALARQAFEEAGVGTRARVLEGRALEVLRTLDAGFDAVFVDADKEPLAQYFEHAVRLVRTGGLVLLDNAFRHGSVIDPSDRTPDTEGIRTFNRLSARDPRLSATIVPIRDGLLVAVKVRA
ncbi:MAG TPA: O-methyltransferase [Gemmatimonadales bacterium]|nr:O-methyltransferase [Gemmatimonadales bacterium]